ncbi:MAG: hypothetical protein Q8P45_01515 [Candidatus Harrisonbacteria bacterium]|nr:hypothetical protein [Candidatus Harrisonbacteria bacterium]
MAYESKRIKQQKFWRKSKRYLLLSSLLLLILFLLYLLFLSEFFVVQAINVTGLKEAQISQEELLDQLKPEVLSTRRGALFSSDRYFGWKEGLNPYQLDALRSIHIKKDFFSRTINISILAQEQSLIWCTQKESSGHDIENCYWINAEAIAFAPSPNPAGQLVPVIREASESQLALGRPVIDEVRWNYIQAIDSSLRNFNIGLKEATLYRDLDELHLKTIDGTRIDFSLRFDPKTTALPALKRLYDPNTPAGHIDLTVENRAFYR